MVDENNVEVTVNVAVVAPAGTVTEAGSENTNQSAAASAMTAPPAGAGDVKVTVPVELAPKITTGGAKLNVARAAGGFTVRVVVLVTPL